MFLLLFGLLIYEQRLRWEIRVTRVTDGWRRRVKVEGCGARREGRGRERRERPESVRAGRWNEEKDEAEVRGRDQREGDRRERTMHAEAKETRMGRRGIGRDMSGAYGSIQDIPL